MDLFGSFNVPLRKEPFALLVKKETFEKYRPAFEDQLPILCLHLMTCQ